MVAFTRILAASSAILFTGGQAGRIAGEEGSHKSIKLVEPGHDGTADDQDDGQVLQDFFDHRHNFIPSAQAETLWAVRVLRHAALPNPNLAQLWPAEWELGDEKQEPTLMDLVWHWIQLMTNNRYSGPPFSLDPPIIFEGDLRNTRPEELVWALQTGHHFKNGFIEKQCVYGMDCYVNARLDPDYPVRGRGPQCESVLMHERHDEVRRSPLFELRGREEVNGTNEEIAKTLQRQESVHNKHAGIAPLDEMPEEAKNFFPRPILHGGKNYNMRSHKGGVDDVFFGAGAPFIAGASGSIEYLIHTMEDTLSDEVPYGLVPCGEGGPDSTPHLREAFIAVMAAILVAGGQHSLGECLAVAQELGYFASIPSFIYQSQDGQQDASYVDVAAFFETYVDSLGVKGSQGVLTQLAMNL